MPPRRAKKAEAGKENGIAPSRDVEMQEAVKPSAKREGAAKADKQQPKKPRKSGEPLVAVVDTKQPTSEAPATEAERRGAARAASKNLQLKDSSTFRESKKRDVVDIKEEIKADSEASALTATSSSAADNANTAARRVGDFTVVDESGVLEPLENASQKPLFISGVIYPKEGPTNKQTGRRVERFGPITSFKLDFSNASVAIVISTEAAAYTCVKPSAAYRKVYSHLSEQADIMYEVYKTLSPSHDGNGEASLEEVIARVARAKVAKSYGGPKEGLLVNGKFILSQLEKLDERTKTGFSFTQTPFAITLADTLKDFKYVGAAQQNRQTGGGIVIRDTSRDDTAREDSPSDAQMEADEEFARQLQAKMDAESRGQQNRNKNGGSAKISGQAYIKVSESEIADDYPGPTPYLKEEEETDELLLYDDELAGLDTEYLPRRLLKDFSIYNAEGLMATLELLPMQAGVDPDVELFASGIVYEDDGDFSGGQSLADTTAGGGSGAGGSGGSSSHAAATTTEEQPGMRMFLSNIKEWVVEFGADMCFITIRTDVAWYRLGQPAERYAPWFNTVLKIARIAGKIMTDMTKQSRASKVSFDDVKKDLAALPAFLGDGEDKVPNPLFIAKKADKIERFLCVHGQIILNCFMSYPVKTVRDSGFIITLKRKLAEVRHSKLYRAAPKASRSRAVNRNPMKDTSAGARAKPMTATATTMVKSIWQAYFAVGAKPEGEEDGQAAAAEALATMANIAKEVEEDINEEENDEEEQENALAEGSPAKASKKVVKKKAAKAAWVGSSTGTVDGDKMFAKAKIGTLEFGIGDIVEVLAEEDANGSDGEDEEVEASPEFGIVQAMWQSASGSAKHIQLRILVPGSETVLGDAASDWELFLTTHIVNFPLNAVVDTPPAKRLQRTWNAALRRQHFEEDEELRQSNAAKVAAGQRPELFWRRLYRPDQGMFCDPPADLRLGERLPDDEQVEAEEEEALNSIKVLPNNAGFVKQGTEYRIGDFVFVSPDCFEQMPEAQRELELPSYLNASRFHKGSHVGLRAYGIGRVVSIKKSGGGSSKKKTRDQQSEETVTSIKVQRYWRPEDISMHMAYEAKSYHDVFASKEEVEVDIEDVVSKIRVVPKGYPTDIQTFICVGTFTPDPTVYQPQPKPAAKPKATKRKGKKSSESESEDEESDTEMVDAEPAATKKTAAAKKKDAAAKGASTSKAAEMKKEKGLAMLRDGTPIISGTIGAAPTDLPIPDDLESFKPAAAAAGGGAGSGKGKGKAAAVDVEMTDAPEDKGKGTAVAVASALPTGGDGISLATMDIFAGCGGLSEGMHQAGAAHTRWAIEYEPPAAEAFKLNNPDSAVFCNNCNVLLHAAMDKAGLIEDCLASKEAEEESAKLAAEEREKLPAPGEVEFICGGPPCQGYSGMNRFNKGNWSMVQNSMVMSFLSYCDFYRPRYFLLENVRNFVSHNKSFTFRLTVRSLLEMGYQVRFGVLNAGNFGVSQSRKRTFIWAAAPGELLPDWPTLMHAFRTPQLTINMPGGVQYTAVPQTDGAPLRPVTVRDAIAELPAITNGADNDEMPYSAEPQSAFQRAIRGDCTHLYDHVAKQMNDINLKRCEFIPTNVPGADWRTLQQLVNDKQAEAEYNGQPLVPWCLPNTADRHNQWRGLFGRLDWDGHFPTSTTDPQPMGKVGQVFHPEQNRIVSVRECARSQGFPDRFRFYGTVQNKHRQVGNAVPPPLAAALGRELRKKLEEKAEEQAKAQLAAQLGF